MLARDALVIYKIDTKKLVFVSSVQFQPGAWT